jgi:hypothetical protein
MTQKLFRDPIYDYIAIDASKYPWILELINCPEVQRLRYISQLGLSHFTYPGSTHSRFSHSLGVFHLMQQCMFHLEQNGFKRHFSELDKKALLATALLHDIGHGPFSHATEGLFGKHEAKTIEIILDSSSNVNKILKKHSKKLPSKVASLISEKPIDGIKAHLWQRSLISSQIDMDRLDYLRRDSLYSGAEYGNFDCFRIIHTMQLKEEKIKGRQKDIFVVWPNKSKYALEEYIFSRFYMYQSVYFHHTTRGFECLLRKIFKCAQDIAKREKNFVKRLLPPIKILFSETKENNLSNFQNLTDHVVLAQITLWKDDKDKTLSDLAQRLLVRKGIGWMEMPKATSFEMTDKITKVREYLQQEGLNDDFYFFEDETQATAYKPYSSTSSSGEFSSVNSIILADPSWPKTGFYEITAVPGLERLQAITSPSSALRYYFPKEYERQIKKILS